MSGKMPCSGGKLPAVSRMNARMACCPASGRQFVEQGLGIFQVEHLESLGEAAIDRCQKIAGLVSLALIAPQPRQAHRCPQFPEL
jgi:hypothetical protein